MRQGLLTRVFASARNFVVEHLPGQRLGTREWENPDGSKATVSADAHIEPGSHIPATAIIMPGASVRATDKIRPGEIILPEGSFRFGEAPVPRPDH
jgi:hypothetical protein